MKLHWLLAAGVQFHEILSMPIAAADRNQVFQARRNFILDERFKFSANS